MFAWSTAGLRRAGSGRNPRLSRRALESTHGEVKMRLANIHIQWDRAEIALAHLPGPARFLATENRDSEGHAARTDFRDENLKAKIRAAAGESEEERQRERLSEPTR